MTVYDPMKTLSDNVAAFGYGHKPGTIYGKRIVFNLTTGEEIGEMDDFQCAEWLKRVSHNCAA